MNRIITHTHAEALSLSLSFSHSLHVVRGREGFVPYNLRREEEGEGKPCSVTHTPSEGQTVHQAKEGG